MEEHIEKQFFLWHLGVRCCSILFAFGDFYYHHHRILLQEFLNIIPRQPL